MTEENGIVEEVVAEEATTETFTPEMETVEGVSEVSETENVQDAKEEELLPE